MQWRQQHPRQRPRSQQDHRCSTLYFVAPSTPQWKTVAGWTPWRTLAWVARTNSDLKCKRRCTWIASV
jgi:hypothetical protein